MSTKRINVYFFRLKVFLVLSPASISEETVNIDMAGDGTKALDHYYWGRWLVPFMFM